MKTQTTVKPTQDENSRLISEFMGEKYSIGLMGQPLINHKTIGYTPIRYHDSWDWLMPVIEKIGDTRIYSDRGYKVEIVNGYTKIEGTSERIFYNSSVEGGMLNATYKACVQFVGWLKLRQKGGGQNGD